MFNILYRPEEFSGKRFIAYGRIAGAGLLEDPYYNGSWQIPYAPGTDQNAIGTLVEVRGRVKDAALEDCVLTVMP